MMTEGWEVRNFVGIRTYNFGKFCITIHEEIWVLPGILLVWGLFFWELEDKKLLKKNTEVVRNKLGYF